MKIYKISMASILVLLLASSCSKLELKPEGIVPAESAVKNEKDVADVLFSSYTVLRDGGYWGGGLQRNSELMTEAIDPENLIGQSAFSVYNYATTGNTGDIAGLCEKPYVIIQRCNVALENINLVTSSAAQKNNYLGQASFLKGMAYFDLVKMFAQPFGFTTNNTHPGVVIKNTSFYDAGLARSSVNDVYNTIISELKKADSLLPASNGVYANRWAAKAMLARVYFQMNDFTNAYNYANDVISATAFTFNTNANFVTNRFSISPNSEAIFSIINEPTLGAAFGGLRNDGNNINFSMNLNILKSAFDAGFVNTNDRRRAWYKDSVLNPGKSIYGVRKYNAITFNLPVIHLTELKLIRAESAAERNTNLTVAIGDINDITNRAYAGAVAPLPGTATAAVIRTLVRAEHIKEMMFESGDRLQQIKRIGAKGETSMVGTVNWNCPGMVLQFPAREVISNANFVQNPTGSCGR